jgi:hypothetical protein
MTAKLISLDLNMNTKLFPNITDTISWLSFSKLRNILICDIVNDMHSKNNNILIISDRTEQIDILYDTLNVLYNLDDIGKFVGGMSKSDLMISLTKSIIIGTYTMITSEYHNPNINVIIFATPRSYIKEIMFKILSGNLDSKNIIVIDIIDINFEKQTKNRLNYYTENNFSVYETSIILS